MQLINNSEEPTINVILLKPYSSFFRAFFSSNWFLTLFNWTGVFQLHLSSFIYHLFMHERLFRNTGQML